MAISTYEDLEISKDDPRFGKATTDEIFESWLDQMVLDMMAGKKVKFNWAFLQGSRYSGKTHAILKLFMKAFLAVREHQVICYIVRKKHDQLSDMKVQFFKDLETDHNFIVEQGKNYVGGNKNYLKDGDNHIVFKTLNHDKIKVDDGGTTGGTT